MTDFKLYAIELENRKVFLQVSMPIYEEFLFQECRAMFDFVKKNPPVKIIHTIDLDDVLKVNYWVKYFMRYYGIDNVRGGNYREEILSPETVEFLKREIETTMEDYEQDIELFESVLTSYNSKNLDEEEKKRLENKLRDYNDRQTLLKFLEIDDDALLKDIEWIANEIINIRSAYESTYESKKSGYGILSSIYSRVSSSTNTLEKNKYRAILKKLQSLITRYYLLNEENVLEYCGDPYLRNKLDSFEQTKMETTVLLVNPGFTLDNFFLHPHSLMNWDHQIEIVNDLIDKWLHMFYSIKNWRDELRFDLSTFPPDFEKHTQYALQLYEMRTRIH